MDQNRLEGAARETAGRIEQAAGEFIGDAKTKVQGKIDQAAGKLQSNYAAAAEDLEVIAERLRERIADQPLTAMLLAAAVGYLVGRIGRWI
jgi:uncharacterized protein YjbJ (UPF0337 family)